MALHSLELHARNDDGDDSVASIYKQYSLARAKAGCVNKHEGF